MGLKEEDDDDDDENSEYYDAKGIAEPDVHSSPSSPVLLHEEALEPTEAFPPQLVQTEDEQPTPENDKTSKKRKGKGKAEPAAAPRLSKAEQKALEREAALQSALEKNDGDALKSTQKSKRKPKNGTIDAMAAATGAFTPAELEPPIEGDTFKMENLGPDAVSEMSKKDKRRAKEAAKKAQQEAGSSSVSLVSRSTRFHP